MTATNHTEHYELSQYTENDHPTYTGDYNGDMRKIDAAIHAASQSGMTAVAHTNDLTGDGTGDTPLKLAPGTLLTQIQEASDDLNRYTKEGLYVITSFPSPRNMPAGVYDIRGTLIVFTRPHSVYIGQMLLVNLSNGRSINWLYLRTANTRENNWGKWQRVALIDDIPDVAALTSRIAALESQVATLAAAATGTTGLTEE
jgi:hypothetical protein